MENKTNNRVKILNAAWKLFEEKGYDNTTVDEIIEATDTDGNVTTFTIYTKPISALSEPIATLNEYNVTEDNKTAIEQVRSTALNTDARYSPPSESKALDSIVTVCDTLLDKISSVKAEFERIVLFAEKYEQISSAELSQSELTEFYGDINALIITNNLTNAQKTTLGEIRIKCDGWLAIFRTED